MVVVAEKLSFRDSDILYSFAVVSFVFISALIFSFGSGGFSCNACLAVVSIFSLSALFSTLVCPLELEHTICSDLVTYDCSSTKAFSVLMDCSLSAGRDS